MTAFAAFVAFDNSPAPDGVEKRLGAALEGVGLERLRVVRLPGAVFVCRQRLLAPEDRHEAQPWQGNSGIVSLFDGRLDNRLELIERLGLRSAQGSDIGDGHLAMLLYERLGPDAAQHLLGDFAWAVWDPRARRLSLARDHSQHRALFHAGEKGWRAFATGYRPLLTLPQVPTDVDELAVAELLLTCTDTSDRSFYKAIRHVRPATQVQFGPEGESSRILWRPDYDREAPAERTAGDHVEQMRSLFESAVAARTRVIGPVVSSVSGGLDSSAIAATAARQRAPDTVHALCVVPVDGEGLSNGDRYPDERPFVTTLASLYPNLQVDYLASADIEPLETDPEGYFLQAGMPMRSPSNAAWLLRMFRRTRELGNATLLDGSWGNYTISAEGTDRLEALRRAGAWGGYAREMAALWQTLPSSRSKGLLRHGIRQTLPASLRDRLSRLRHGERKPPWQGLTAFSHDYFRDHRLDDHYREHAVMLLDTLAKGSRQSIMRYVLERSRMQMETTTALRIVMGVTLSDPFSDRRIVDLAMALPDDQFLAGGVTRALARRVFADRLPSAILQNFRRGAQNGDWHHRLTPHRDRLSEALSRAERSTLAAKMLDLPRLRRLIDDWPLDRETANAQQRSYRVMLLRSLHVAQFLSWIEGGNR